MGNEHKFTRQGQVVTPSTNCKLPVVTFPLHGSEKYPTFEETSVLIARHKAQDFMLASPSNTRVFVPVLTLFADPDPTGANAVRKGPRTPPALSGIRECGAFLQVALRALLLWGILAGAVSLPLAAAELHLRNGDRLTGELVNRIDGKIYFRSPLLGDVVVSETDASVIESVEIPVESLTGLPPAKGPTVAQVKPGSSVTQSPKVIAPAPTPAVAAKTGPASSPQKPAIGASPNAGRWKAKVELGVQQQSGRQDGLNTSVRADAERERGKNQIKSNLRFLYSELNDRVSTDRADASVRWRYQLSKRVFAQSVTSFLSDNVKQIDQNYEQNAGFGYALVKRDRHVINVGGGFTGQFRQAVNINQGFAFLGEVFQDYTYKINGRLTFIQDLLTQYSPATQDQYILRNGTFVPTSGEIQNYRIRFNTTLQGKVTEKISMNLRFEYDFDNTISDRDAKVDQRISSSLGYAF